MIPLSIRVFGRPAPKGSHKVIHGRVVAVNDAALQRWERSVRAGSEAARARVRGDVEEGGPPIFVARALVVEVTFALPRESGNARVRVDRREYPHYSVHDLDKLVRATLDPMQGVIYDDDRRIVTLHARKTYDGVPYGLRGTGAIIDVWPIDEQEEIQNGKEATRSARHRARDRSRDRGDRAAVRDGALQADVVPEEGDRAQEPAPRGDDAAPGGDLRRLRQGRQRVSRPAE